MNRLIITSFAMAALSFFLSSCASENVQKRVDRRDGALNKMGENMEIRQEARDQRYNDRFDRMMN
ncbi:MAG: hypothetical protein KDN19_12570 [Verrucomicrobiae bacterium]|nr:hypothetical protein [Verrucomicrobiae bacterium]